jgi:hypothetical protein
MWELHLFPGGKVGECKTRFGVWLWMLFHTFTLQEKRAINKETREHIVKW